MKKIKPYLLPGLVGFYVLFSVSMILVGKQVENAGSPNTANPVFMVCLLGLISQLVLVSVWAGFGPEPWLQRLPLCTLCGLLSLLAFEQTFYLMFGHTSYHYGGSDPIVLVLLGCPFLVAWLCCLRALPWFSWQIVRQPQPALPHHPRNSSTSRGRTLLLTATACGILFAIPRQSVIEDIYLRDGWYLAHVTAGISWLSPAIPQTTQSRQPRYRKHGEKKSPGSRQKPQPVRYHRRFPCVHARGGANRFYAGPRR